jgi:hypothetical protein
MEDGMTDDAAHNPPLGGGYEVGYLAFRHEISLDEARKLIAQVGNDRLRLDRAAVALKKQLHRE